MLNSMDWSAVDSLDGLGSGSLDFLDWSAVDSLDGLGSGMLNSMDWFAVDFLDFSIVRISSVLHNAFSGDFDVSG